VVTVGESIIATAPLRWVKSAALGALTDSIDRDARLVLKGGLEKFAADGRDYNAIRTDPEAMRAAIREYGLLQETASRFKEDDEGKRAVEDVVIDIAGNFTRAQLEGIAENRQAIAQADQHLADLGGKLEDYWKDTGKALDGLKNDLVAANDTANRTGAVVEKLLKDNKVTTEQLQILSDVMFRQASPQERLNMLKCGYLKSAVKSKTITDPQYQAVFAATEAEVSRQELTGTVNNVVNKIDNIGNIARSLGISSPVLDTSITVADSGSKVVGDVLRGDFLGALSGVTGLFGGLFGGHRDPAAERHKQLMDFLTGC
jgi:hypothetical protein